MNLSPSFHRPAVALLAVFLVAAAAAADPAPATRPSPAPTITLADVNGRPHAPLAGAATRPATVLIFTLPDCPVANGYAPEVNRIVAAYARRGVAVYLVHVDDTLTPADARRHAAEYAFTCPVLLDPGHALVAAAGATVTPEAAVFNATGALVYRGRIDDRYVAPGKARIEPTVRDLRNVLDALLAGRAVTFTTTRAFGCYIPTK